MMAASRPPPMPSGMNASALKAKGYSTTGEPFKKPMTAYMCFLKEQTALIS
jgi:hypothetical protein